MKLLFPLLLLFVNTHLLAQDTLPYYKIDWEPYSFRSGKFTIGEEPTIFAKVLNQQFSNLVTGQSSTSIGNFASVTPTDARIDFAGNFITSKGSVFTMKASGKATDGLVAVFENSKLNTDVSLDFKYHVLSLHRRSLSINRDSGLLYEQKLEGAKYDFRSERLKITYGRSLLGLEKKRETVQKELDSLNALLSAANQQKDAATLLYEISVREHLCDSVAFATVLQASTLTQLRNLHAVTIAKVEKLASFTVRGFEMNWWSFGYKVSNRKFKLFYPAATFEAQIVDSSFVSHEASVQWSYYKWRSQGFKTFFTSIGLTLGYDDNFSSLDKREVSETVNYGPTSGTRSVNKKFDAYEGDYEKKLVSLNIYSDNYFFLFNENKAALHFNPEWVIKKNEKPKANCFTGLLLSFKKKDEETTWLNAEIYYQFQDMFKASESDYKLFERNAIGLRFAFPIQFKIK